MEATIPHIELDCILIDSATQVRGFKSGGDEPRGMYAVVGCNECAAMWLLMDPQTSDSARCPRCGKTHQTTKLKRFFESEDREAAREARAALLAKKRDESAAFAELDHVSELERRRRVGNRRPRVPRSVGDRRRRRRRGGRPRRGGASRTRGVGVRSSATRWRPSTSRPRRTSWRTRATTVSPPRRPERS